MQKPEGGYNPLPPGRELKFGIHVLQGAESKTGMLARHCISETILSCGTVKPGRIVQGTINTILAPLKTNTIESIDEPDSTAPVLFLARRWRPRPRSIAPATGSHRGQ